MLRRSQLPSVVPPEQMIKILKMIWDNSRTLPHAGIMTIAGVTIMVWEMPNTDLEKNSIFKITSITWDDLHIDVEYAPKKAYGYLSASYPGSVDDALITLALKFSI